MKLVHWFIGSLDHSIIEKVETGCHRPCFCLLRQNNLITNTHDNHFLWISEFVDSWMNFGYFFAFPFLFSVT
jgi:hypothetical protein